MSASIAHMLIAKAVKERVSQVKTDKIFSEFIEKVLKENERYFVLGALGPDMPYFEKYLSLVLLSLKDRPNLPEGVDGPSYSLHSRNPNVFPLKLLEITWKESDINKNEWEVVDYQRLAFACGYVCHVGTDHIIHPLIQQIAGAYYKGQTATEESSREKHRNAEIAQDLYLLYKLNNEKLTRSDFKKIRFEDWCTVPPSDELVYLIQKAFVEAHCVLPYKCSVQKWIKHTPGMPRMGMWNFWGLKKLPYAKVHAEMFDKKGKIMPGSKPYTAGIERKDGTSVKKYTDYVDNAVRLSALYLLAAFEIFALDELEDEQRENFKKIVSN
jgi:hypothetical protein